MKNKIHSVIIVVIILSCNAIYSQKNWGSFSQAVDVSEYVGQEFKFSAIVRVDLDDDSASIRLWSRVDLKKGTGFFDNMWENPIRDSLWTEHNLIGTIDTNAVQLAFGLLCEFNGKFLADNIKLEIKGKDNNWTTIFYEDFESGKLNLEQGIQNLKHEINDKYHAKITNDSANNSNMCFLIIGEGVPNYGYNGEAGNFVDVNDIRLYYEIYGEGYPLLLLHGNGGSISFSSQLIPDLSKKYKVIAVDSRAQGRSTDSEEPLTYKIMASDINKFLDYLSLDSLLIYGHSDGAIIGLILAIDYPEKVKKLLAFGANTQPDTSALFQYVIDYDKKRLNSTDNMKIRKLMQLMIDYPNIPFTELKDIKAPILVMTGDRDLIKLTHTINIFQNIPNSQLCVIPGSTHWASWEKKDLFLEIMYDFFDNPFSMPDSKNEMK